MQPARTRIAPSPTGYVHIGTLRTALFDYFISQQSGGQFIIRIEDTDRERLVEGSIENLLDVFARVGVHHDEGPVLNEDGIIEDKGDYGPYIQSQRLDLYRPYVDKLVEQGDAYPCFCTRERLDEMREQQRATKQTPKYDRHCLSLSDEEVARRLDAGESHVIRMKIPAGETVVEDVIRGTVKFNNSDVDDQVILKSDGFPTYHLAVVVDDHLMKITHMLRGEEWLSSAPKQVILHDMLGMEMPKYAHVPLILNPDKTKLSKRQGDVSVEDYLRRGYLPEAIINFIGTLGFNPRSDQEIYSVQELIENFDLSRVNRAGAVLNMDKLNWMNNHYITALDIDDLANRCAGFVQADVMNPLVQRALYVERSRVNRLDEFNDHITTYISEPSFDPAILVWKKTTKENAQDCLKRVHAWIEAQDESLFERVDTIEEALKAWIAEHELGNGNVLWPLRTGLSGKERSASPFEYLWVLKKAESMKRIQHALDLLQ